MATLIQDEPKPHNVSDRKKEGFSSKSPRGLELNYLEVGDEFIIPENFEIYEQNIGGYIVDYINIELTDGRKKVFYPSVFAKQRSVYNEDGTLVQPVQRVATKGSAADLSCSLGYDIARTMDKLRGRKLKVTNVEHIRTLRLGTTSTMMTTIPTIDIIE